jgi:hypothetical protein
MLRDRFEVFTWCIHLLGALAVLYVGREETAASIYRARVQYVLSQKAAPLLLCFFPDELWRPDFGRVGLPGGGGHRQP